MFSFHSYPRRLVSLTLLLFLSTSLALAQDDERKPTYVTARLFVAIVPRKQPNLTDQLFRLRTPAPADDEKWLSNFKKAYPEAIHFALLRTQQLRLFMIPKPGILVVGDPNYPHIEAQFLLAEGLRNDDTINTTAITEINFYGGPKSSHPVPLSMANNGFEVENKMTYFYTSDGLKLKPDVYAVYFRERSYAPILDQYDHYVILSLSVEPDKHPGLAFDAAKSSALQQKASKKVDPQWPDDITKNYLFGHVQVRVEIGADGKVAKATVWQSTMPEANLQALAAARQWEFPPSELAGINSPASALLTFTVAPPAPPKAPEQKTPSEVKSQSEAKSADKPITVTKPPVKRRDN